MKQDKKAQLTQGILIKTHPCVKQDKDIRHNISEKQIDKMLKDSFPASDSVSLY